MPRNRTSPVAAILLGLNLAACASSPPTTVAATRQGQLAYEEVGLASWYGDRYHGRRTASGERFDMNAHSAAHPRLPFGAQVRVENLENGRSVVLRINDRGPFVRGRIIDVSKHAADHLDFRRQGVARVRVRAL